MKYSKPPLSLDKQIELLVSRGMIISEVKSAKHFLETHNYYRFTGYSLHFEIFEERKRTHKFRDNTKFEDVLRLYEFDVKLRNLVFQSVKEIEIAFRTQMCLILANKYKDSHWYLNRNIYNSDFKYDKFIEDCESEMKASREIFIEHYRNKYTNPKLPPSWMMIEILSFGKWSKLFSNLKDKGDRKCISGYFKVNEKMFGTWLYGLSYIRNLYSHHCRLWNRNFQFRSPLKKEYGDIVISNERLGAYLCIIYDLLVAISPEFDFFTKLKDLINFYPEIPIEKMGLKQGWDNPELWKFNL